MRTFIVIWLGQIISQLGSAMTGFAVSIWLYEQTGEATTLSIAMGAYITSLIVVSIFAGTIVDRSDRKTIMIVSDLVAGVTTIIMLILFLNGSLALWHIVILNIFNGGFNSLQWPAFSSAITMLVPKEQYARVDGLQSLGGSASGIFAPMLAAALLAVVGFQGVMVIDIVSFLFAVGALLFVTIPNPPRTEAGAEGSGSFLQETAYGFRYVFKRPSLVALQSVFLVLNFFATFGVVITIPMILARTGNNEVLLGTVQGIGAAGGVAGGLLLTAWGGFKRRIHGVLGGMIMSSLLGTVLMGLGSGPIMWAMAAFFSSFFIPILNGSNQAIWQSKVAPDLQGRVFSVRRLIAWLVNPIATFAAGPVADNVFEPAMMEGGRWSETFGWLVDTGAGSGMSLMFIVMGVCMASAAIIGYCVPIVRNVEDILPDHEVDLTT